MKKLTGLQWGRGFAAMAVVVGHAIVHPLQSPPELAQYLGRLGVTLFFIISGFIMVATTGPGRFDLRSFARKRLQRIVPLYYFITALVAVAALAAPSLFKGTVFDLGHLIQSLLFIPAYRPASGEIVPFMKLGWTLNYEMFFYACFAALCFLGAAQRVITLTVLFAMLMVIGQLFRFDSAPLAFYTRLDLLGFVAGMWIALLHQRGVLKSETLPEPALLFGALGLALVTGVFYTQIATAVTTQFLIVGICALATIALAYGVEAWTERGPKVLTLLGDASYSIYLFHLFAIGIAVNVAERLLPMPLYLVVGIGIVAGSLAGLIGYYVVERPLTRLFAPSGQNRVKPPVPQTAAS